MPKTVLIDSCVWFDFIEEKDDSLALYDLIDAAKMNIILPFPCLYEVLNTRLTRRRRELLAFEQLMKNPLVVLFDDSLYRDDALEQVFSTARQGFTFSFVDTVLRRIVQDKTVRLDYLATINTGDFQDVCDGRGIEILNY
jgi:predicted nucleic acid-binding protein